MKLARAKSKAAVAMAPAQAREESSVAASMEALSSEVSFSDTAKQQHCQADERFLCVTVHEARNLVAKDLDTASSDPFVRISCAGCVRKTRVIYRNRHPLWEQKLLMPLDGLSEAQPLLIELFDKDFRAKEFLGQVLMTLGKALEIAADAALGAGYWFPVSKRHSSDRVSGELCLGFGVTGGTAYASLVEQLEREADNEHIAKMLSSKALHVRLHGINGLSGLLARSGKQRSTAGLSLLIKIGRRVIERALPDLPPADGGSQSCLNDGFELAVNEEVVIPLAAAVRAAPLVVRRKDELLDVKICLNRGTTTVAKTQIPVLSIPVASSSSSGSDAPEGLAAFAPAAAAMVAGEAVAEVVVAKPQMTSAKSLSDLSALRLCDDSLASSCDLCLPSTPRGMRSSAEFLLATLRGCGTSSASTSPGPGSPRPTAARAPELDLLVQRSKSDAAGVLSHKQQLQFAVDAAGGNGTSKGGRFVEGSLGSVTASSRCQQGSVGVAKRKAQGLAEFNDSVRSAFKLRPKEVSHGPWTRAGDELLVSQQARLYSRPMESLVQLPSQLEVGLALALVEQSGTGADAASEAVDSTGVEALLDDLEDGEAPEAVPLAAPEPFQLVLVDESLSMGVNRLHSLLLGSGSALMAEHQAAEQLLDVTTGPWLAGQGGMCLRMRQVSYTKRLNIPFAPKQCQVWEEHRLLEKTDGGFVAEIACTNNAPKGDCFVARIQLVGVMQANGSSRLRVSMKLDWHKSTLGKSLVQSGAEGDAKRSWAALLKRLKQMSVPGGSSLQTVSATPSEQAATAVAGGNASSIAGHWQGRQAALLLSLLLAAVLVVLVALVVVVHRGASSISRELNLLTQVLRELSSAACSSASGDAVAGAIVEL